ncbi:hypothetical protein D6783_00020, partial [Candidatus Woesearchaeota archaeon]
VRHRGLACGEETMTTWKNTERRIAKKLNGVRVGATGAATEDVRSDWLSVEVKHRKRLPVWLWDAYSQARNGTIDGERLAIVVLHEHGKHDDMVLLSLRDFIEWFGD